MYGGRWLARANYRDLEGYEESEQSCDGLDNDCDGSVDESIIAPLISEQRGVCQGVTMVCFGGLGWVNPELERLTGYEELEQSCDGLDNDRMVWLMKTSPPIEPESKWRLPRNCSSLPW